MKKNKRFEYKYLLNFSDYLIIKNYLLGFCYYDKNSLKNDRRYLVRSIYYDNYNYDSYVGKIHGNALRSKYRIRTYDVKSKNPLLTLENKSKHGIFTFKDTNKITYDEYLYLYKYNNLKNIDTNLKEEFMYELNAYNLKPLTIVQYFREALYLNNSTNLRFSFDHDISYFKSSYIFEKDKNFIKDKGSKVVFEIKTIYENSEFLRNFVMKFNLIYFKNSKYANSFEHAINDVFY